MSTFLTELRRYRRRPAIRRTLMIVALLALVIPVVAFARAESTAPAGPGDADYDAAVAACREDMAPFAADADIDASCEETARLQFPDKRYCATKLLASNPTCSPPIQSVDELLDLSYDVELPAGVRLERPRPGLMGTLTAVGVLLSLVAAALGSTFVGAEHRHGTYEAALVAEPRRTRLLVARFAAGVVGTATGVAAVLVVFVLGYIPAIVWRGVPDSVPDGFWAALAAQGMRIVAVAAGMALLGMGVSAAARHTAAGIVGVFGALVGSTILGLSVLPAVIPWDPIRNVVAVVAQGEVAQVREFPDPAGGPVGYQVEVAHHGPGYAAGIVSAYAVLGVAAAAATLRRDVD